MDVRMAAALAQGVDDVAAFCRAQGISRQSYYKWKKRFEPEGLDGLRDRSRRPSIDPDRDTGRGRGSDRAGPQGAR